ncbi:hypothetical protein AAFF_G00251040 [Aldrovandia affinis]|uniref:Uncharacterized protein n=1 Tax=Aldrovandia affinis TaxID=143900 RepID=A0AAD7RCY8_9TELE|nr:hypothetical protein AAFF_G00251040 [Aldrovandia affinis]
MFESLVNSEILLTRTLWFPPVCQTLYVLQVYGASGGECAPTLPDPSHAQSGGMCPHTSGESGQRPAREAGRVKNASAVSHQHFLMQPPLLSDAVVHT